MKDRLVNMIFALDCCLFSWATLGKAYPFESFSSAAYRAESMNLFYGKFRPLIDKILGKDHCYQAYLRAKYNLPPDQRGL